MCFKNHDQQSLDDFMAIGNSNIVLEECDFSKTKRFRIIVTVFLQDLNKLMSSVQISSSKFLFSSEIGS